MIAHQQTPSTAVARVKWMVVAVLVLIIGGATLMVVISRSLRNICKITVISVLSSPNGERRSVVFDRSCGATTGFSTQVAIIGPLDSLPEDADNVWIADTDHGRAPGASWGGPNVDVRWRGNDTLAISHDAEVRIFLKDTLVHDVVVTYNTERR